MLTFKFNVTEKTKVYHVTRRYNVYEAYAQNMPFSFGSD